MSRTQRIIGRFPCPFLRMSRMKGSFWKISLSVFANVSYETLILEDFLDAFKAGGPLVGQKIIKMKLSGKELYKELSKLQYLSRIRNAHFGRFLYPSCECLVRNAHFGRFPSLFLQMSRTKCSFWKVSLSVFANVSYETLFLEDFLVRFCECLVRNAHFGRSLCQFLRMSRTKRSFWKISLLVFANVSYETLILEDLFVSFCECLVRNALLEDFLVRFCECLVRNAHFGRSLCQFLRMSRMKRSFWKVSLSVFANVSYETLILEDFLVRFCECLVRNAHFGRSFCPFLRMSRTKRSFWKVSFSVFANVSYEALILEDFPVSFCECLVRKAHFERFPCPFLRMSRTKRLFWKLSLSVFANVSYETLILEDLFVSFCECLVRNAHFGRSLC